MRQNKQIILISLLSGLTPSMIYGGTPLRSHARQSTQHPALQSFHRAAPHAVNRSAPHTARRPAQEVLPANDSTSAPTRVEIEEDCLFSNDSRSPVPSHENLSGIDHQAYTTQEVAVGQQVTTVPSRFHLNSNGVTLDNSAPPMTIDHSAQCLRPLEFARQKTLKKFYLDSQSYPFIIFPASQPRQYCQYNPTSATFSELYLSHGPGVISLNDNQVEVPGFESFYQMMRGYVPPSGSFLDEQEVVNWMLYGRHVRQSERGKLSLIRWSSESGRIQDIIQVSYAEYKDIHASEQLSNQAQAQTQRSNNPHNFSFMQRPAHLHDLRQQLNAVFNSSPVEQAAVSALLARSERLAYYFAGHGTHTNTVFNITEEQNLQNAFSQIYRQASRTWDFRLSFRYLMRRISPPLDILEISPSTNVSTALILDYFYLQTALWWSLRHFSKNAGCYFYSQSNTRVNPTEPLLELQTVLQNDRRILLAHLTWKLNEDHIRNRVRPHESRYFMALEAIASRSERAFLYNRWLSWMQSQPSAEYTRDTTQNLVNNQLSLLRWEIQNHKVLTWLGPEDMSTNGNDSELGRLWLLHLRFFQFNNMIRSRTKSNASNRSQSAVSANAGLPRTRHLNWNNFFSRQKPTKSD